MIENYAKNIYRFKAAEPGGGELRPAQVRKQTWRIDTRGSRSVVVEFDYKAAVRIRRCGEDRDLEMTVKFVEFANYRIVESQSPTPEQLKVRESRLKR